MRCFDRGLLLAGILALATSSPALAQANVTGEWTVQRDSLQPSRVQLELRSGEPTHNWDSSHPIDVAQLGLAPSDLDSAGKHVQFTIARAAGAFDCDGWAGGGKGSGTFAFTPNDAFFASLKQRGYGDVEPRQAMGIASIDLTLPYIDSIAAAGYPHLVLHDLIALRALGVTRESIGGLRATFGNDLAEHDVISLTALRVTPSYVAELRSLGISDLNAHHAIELRALGIDRAYVDEMAKAGYPHLDPNQLVQFKALGIDAGYVRYLADHGFHNLPVDKVVQMKAVGI